MLIFTKDSIGYKIVEGEFNGTHFVTKDEEHISQATAYVANSENVVAIYNNQKPRKVGEVYSPDMDAKTVLSYLEKYFLAVDMDMRIHREMGAPLTTMGADYIAPIIMTHVKFCEDNKKNPETIPTNIGQIENEYGVQPVFLMGGMVPVPIPKHPGGEIHIMHDERTNLDRIVLKFSDWFLVPNNYHRFPPVSTFKVMQFLKGTMPTNASSVKEALGDRRFLTEAGVIKTRFNIGFEIDDILGPEGGVK